MTKYCEIICNESPNYCLKFQNMSKSVEKEKHKIGRTCDKWRPNVLSMPIQRLPEKSFEISFYISFLFNHLHDE